MNCPKAGCCAVMTREGLIEIASTDGGDPVAVDRYDCRFCQITVMVVETVRLDAAAGEKMSPEQRREGFVAAMRAVDTMVGRSKI